MVNWRELGEVPDSEEEDGFDSQESQPRPAPDSLLPSIQQPKRSLTTTKTKDVWDVPSSQEDELAQAPEENHFRPPKARSSISPPRPNSHPTESESPLSSLNSTQELPQMMDFVSSPPPPSTAHSQPRPQDHAPSEPSPERPDSTRFINITPTPSIAQIRQVSPQPSPIFRRPQAPLASQILGHDTEHEEARRAAVSYERSLRRRKPEQLRPYFTERTRFNNEWRSHGLRPVRITAEEEQRPQRSQSPEETYEPDSQELQRISDESQQIGRDELEGMVYGMVSSSPLRTSPANHHGGPSSQASQQTDDTSVVWDDLPPIDELAKKHPTPAMNRAFKRKFSTYSSNAKKKRKQTTENTQSSPSAVTRFVRPPSSPVTGSPSHTPSHRQPSHVPAPEPDPFMSSDDDAGMPLDPMDYAETPSKPAPVNIESISDEEVSRDGNGQGAGSVGSSSDNSSSESDSEVVHQNSKRIKGVLPASWLRLDQQYGQKKIQKMTTTQRNASPEREQRRGLAQRRFVKTASRTNDLFFDDSDDEARTNARKTTDEVFHNQTILSVEPVPVHRDIHEVSSDDSGSAMEEDTVDRMAPTYKRQPKISDALGQASKHSKSAFSRMESVKVPRQPKIRDTFGQSGSASRKTQSSGKVRKPRSKRRPNQPGVAKLKTPRRRIAPHLSILDVIEPDAPKFLKIAARTAKRRPDQGRGSPSKKTIQLATRGDHIDAFSALNEWKAGSIRQRPSVSIAKKSRQPWPRPEPLTERHANTPGRPKQGFNSSTGSRKLARQVSTSGLVSYKAAYSSKSPQKAPQRPVVNGFGKEGPKARPAQLEIGDGEANRFAFHSGKKLLDRLYRSKYGDSVVGSTFSEVVSEGRLSSHVNQDTYDDPVERPQPPRRRRKPKPQRIDLEEPQYSHAHDPLPSTWSAAPEPAFVASDAGQSKLQGLGPYGATYSRHFEIFPLVPGVYFHDSTLIGSDAVERVVNWTLVDSDEPRPNVSFVLEEKMLCWGSWNAQVSSEFGIALDYASEQLDQLDGRAESCTSLTVGIADHLLNYTMKRLSFDGEGDAKSFITRLVDSVQSFNQRIKTRLEGALNSGTALLEIVSKIYDRLLLVVYLALKLCQHDTSMMSEQFQVEELLKSVCRLIMSTLHQGGLKCLRVLYKEMNRAHVRERGLRNDSPTVQSWVILMRVLDTVQIPRGSFWDIVQEILVPSRITTTYDAHELERAWEDMFTLLPLTEFNNAGVLVVGQRHDIVKDGWSMPMKLLKRVFELYKQDTRQSPSFNNYCRALLGRCHYLVEQWGWHRCSSIVGVVFDFFGSQNLAHLRNEEFYDSPRFLEDLARQPMLSVEPQDRCFHIFLKLVALGIRKLTEAGSIKDIRNLVARTVPNHNREFLKEQKIHERDLAALRNHHDLLCTLYWAAPPDLRPSVSLIERLVVPASSHKEACLINFRAWRQLARFVVTSGEATTAFRHFHQWRNEFFQEIMQQFNSVATDIEQQFQGLSKDVSKSISTDMISAMVSSNKAAIQDVLHFVVTASLDVMRHAPDLEAAVFCLNTSQLQQIFKHFAQHRPELDWAILRGCLATLDVFLSRVDDFKDEEESQQSESQILNSAQADDALLTLSHDVAESYFSMARSVLSSCGDEGLTMSATVDKAMCVEQVITLSARLVARFINAGVMTLSDVFGRKQYGLFRDVPHKLGLDQRRYLTLFVATLLEHKFDEFDAASSCSLLDLWTLCLVKPRKSLAYENKLAKQLVHCGKKFVPEVAAGLAITPDYSMNRDMFEFAISFMRKEVRDASPSLKRILLAEYMKTLRLVMEQIKNDLKTVVDDNAAEHPRYVGFVRDVIVLIRERGSDICAVDDFFYQINKEYSPSREDPQLLVAGMMSYGLGLSEGDGRACHQLFFFLYNNFKLGVINDKLDDEVRFLQKGMTNPAIFKFVLGKLVPAIVRAVTEEPDFLHLLLDVYVKALHLILGDGVAPRRLAADECPEMLMALRAVFEGLAGMGNSFGTLSNEEVFVARQLLQLMNLLWPSVFALALDSSAKTDPVWKGIQCLLKYCSTFMAARETILLQNTQLGNKDIDANFFLGLKRGDYADLVITTPTDTREEGYISSFTQSIIADVKKNWIVTDTSRICIQAPGKVPGTQQFNSTSLSTPATTSTQAQGEKGVQRPEWADGQVFDSFYGCVREWNYQWDRIFGQNEGGPRERAAREVVEGYERMARVARTVRLLF